MKKNYNFLKIKDLRKFYRITYFLDLFPGSKEEKESMTDEISAFLYYLEFFDLVRHEITCQADYLLELGKTCKKSDEETKKYLMGYLDKVTRKIKKLDNELIISMDYIEGKFNFSGELNLLEILILDILRISNEINENFLFVKNIIKNNFDCASDIFFTFKDYDPLTKCYFNNITKDHRLNLRIEHMGHMAYIFNISSKSVALLNSLIKICKFIEDINKNRF